MGFRNKWLVLGAASFGLFMAVLDATIVTIAVPSIQQSLNTNIENVTWVLNSYNIVFAVLLIPAGRVADRLGRKKMFVAGIIVFTIFSLASGLAGHIGLLIAARALQAVGAAIMVPVSLAIVTIAFPSEQRGLAVGVWGAISGAASAVGPTLGGLLTEYAGWEWIFFINVPVGVLGAIACLYVIPESRAPERRQKVDYPGVVFLSVALFALTLALIRGESSGWSSLFILGLFATFLVSGAFFVANESIVTDPLVDLRMFRQRNFSAANATVLLFGLGFFGALFLFIEYLTVVEGYSVLRAAVSVTPLPVTIVFVGPIAGRLSDRYGSRAMIATGLLIFGLAMFFFSRLGANEAYPQILWRLVVAGVGAGLIFSPLTSAAMGAVTGGRQGLGAGVFNTSRQIGFTLGLAILVAVFLGALHPRLVDAQNQATAFVQQSDLPDSLKQGIIEGIATNVSSSSSQAAVLGEQQKFDLYDRVMQMAGPQAADANRSTLDRLSQQLQTVFARAAASSFDRTFFVAALILWVGALPALFIQRARGDPAHP